MTNVIAFPRRIEPSEAQSSALDQSLNSVVVACLILGTKIETIVDDLEQNLARLSATLPTQATPASELRAKQIADLERRLEMARAMIRSVRADLAQPLSYPLP